ncbi:MAG: magnesium transporter CorA [Oscillospiraceae bacterium]|nr:magnesium transporter CorA [Oscillospiraceae bacterium]
MYYLIQKSLVECRVSELRGAEYPFVAVLTPAEWEREKELFDMGIDLDLNPADIHNTKIEVNYDSLTGTFSLPDRANLLGESRKFAFALDEKGIVFIDDSDTARGIIQKIKNSRQWKMPCLERFLYDFLEQIVHEDLDLMERYDSRLDQIEKDILDTGESGHVKEINLIRSDIRELRIHYEQLMDFVQELEENENGFFREEHLRYFHMLSNRMDRLYNSATHLRDYTMQLSDLYQSQIDLKQNRIMTILTVVTTIFMPLTLITGWYGMNFTYMPELDSPYGYPIIIVVALMIAVASLLYFKRKKWL